MRIDRVIITNNTQGICYCSTGKKTKKIFLKVNEKEFCAKYCQYCRTAYIRQDKYDPIIAERYKVQDNIEKNEELIQTMIEKSKKLVRSRKEALREKQLELKRGERIVREKEIAKTKALEEHKKQNEGKVICYSHDMENHYTRPFVPVSPKQKRKRSFFS